MNPRSVCFTFVWIVCGDLAETDRLLDALTSTFLAEFGASSFHSASGLKQRARLRGRKGWMPSDECRVLEFAFERRQGVTHDAMLAVFGSMAREVVVSPLRLVSAQVLPAQRSLSEMLVQARREFGE